ncbi:MAG: PfkB family carbohydrate kinase [Mariprofundaceae bacterium]
MSGIDVLSIGHAAYDITMAAAHHPAADEKMIADALDLAGGGPAANAAVCIARLGGTASFCGYLGRDIFGDAHMREFEREGVHGSLIVRGEHPSPVSQVLAKPDGSRSVVNYKGDTPWLTGDAADFSTIPARVVLFDGHEPLLSDRAASWAKARGIPAVLDAGSLRRGTRELAERVDVLAASTRFASQFAETADMHIALQRLSGLCPRVVITLGGDGLLWAENGQSGHLPAFNVSVVDSTGAGDAFHGALALAIAREMAWPEALRFASAVGALTCMRLGARTALPGAAAVAELLRQ